MADVTERPAIVGADAILSGEILLDEHSAVHETDQRADCTFGGNKQHRPLSVTECWHTDDLHRGGADGASEEIELRNGAETTLPDVLDLENNHRANGAALPRVHPVGALIDHFTDEDCAGAQR